MAANAHDVLHTGTRRKAGLDEKREPPNKHAVQVVREQTGAKTRGKAKSVDRHPSPQWSLGYKEDAGTTST